MRKIWKIAEFLAVDLIVTGLALAVLAQTLPAPTSIKDRRLPMAEQVLQRRVLLGDVEVGLISGIVLKDLRILEKSGESCPS